MAVLKPPPQAQPPSSPPTSRLTFCAYDFSSVTPPVDVTIGSNLHLENCVSKISDIVAELNKLHALPPSSPATLALSSLLTFTRTLSDRQSTFADQLRCNLALTLPKHAKWPANRFLGAGRFYEKELSVAVQMASADEVRKDKKANTHPPNPHTMVLTSCHHFSPPRRISTTAFSPPPCASALGSSSVLLAVIISASFSTLSLPHTRPPPRNTPPPITRPVAQKSMRLWPWRPPMGGILLPRTAPSAPCLIRP